MIITHSGASELNHLMDGITAGPLTPEIVRRGFQELLEAGVSSLTGTQLHKRCPDQRSTDRNGHPRRLLTTKVGIPHPDYLKATPGQLLPRLVGDPPARWIPWWRPWGPTAASPNRK
jgi:hypothetical protein